MWSLFSLDNWTFRLLFGWLFAWFAWFAWFVGLSSHYLNMADKPADQAHAERRIVLGKLLLTVDQAKQSPLLAGIIDDQTDQTPDGSTDQTDQTGELVIDASCFPDCIQQPDALTLWYDNWPACEIFLVYGISALNELLAAADLLMMQACVNQIIEVCAEIATTKLMNPNQFKLDLLEPVYYQLVSQGLPPIGFAGNVAQLCWLCNKMPAFMKPQMRLLLVTKLFGHIDQLVVSGQKMYINDPTNDLVCQVGTQAICGADWYGVAVCQQVCHLFKSNILHYDQHLAWLSEADPAELVCADAKPPGLAVLASLACTSVDIAASPCQKYILWRVDQPAEAVQAQPVQAQPANQPASQVQAQLAVQPASQVQAQPADQPANPVQAQPVQAQLADQVQAQPVQADQANMPGRCGQKPGRRNMLFCLANQQPVVLPGIIQQASRAWWLGDQLAFSVPGRAVFQTRRTDQLHQLDQPDQFGNPAHMTFNGTCAATSGAVLCSTQSCCETTMMEVWHAGQCCVSTISGTVEVVCADRRDETGRKFVMRLAVRGRPDVYHLVTAPFEGVNRLAACGRLATRQVDQLCATVVWRR